MVNVRPWQCELTVPLAPGERRNVVEGMLYTAGDRAFIIVVSEAIGGPHCGESALTLDIRGAFYKRHWNAYTHSAASDYQAVITKVLCKRKLFH